MFLLDPRALLLKTSNLLEEIVETLEILKDKEAMETIKEAEEDIKVGRTRNYKDFIEEAEKIWRNIKV